MMIRTLFSLLLSFTLVSSAFAAQPPIPQLAAWESQMLTYGQRLCDKKQIIKTGPVDESGMWYYDGTRVYYQIADYTGNPAWNICAGYVRDVYRPYALAGGVPGWRVFPHGMYMDFVRTRDPISGQAVVSLATTSAFASSGGGADWSLSRETAYIMSTYIRWELIGGNAAQLPQSFLWSLGHLDQWFVSKTAGIVKPFMVGLTAEALIDYYQNVSEDPRILPGLTTAADWLWANAWSPTAHAFQYGVCRSSRYTKECKQGPAPDLNLLIAPMYAWLYHQTGQTRFLSEGDAIFAGGVTSAYLGDGKHFNQNYRWSFDYVKWRSMDPLH